MREREELENASPDTCVSPRQARVGDSLQPSLFDVSVSTQTKKERDVTLSPALRMPK